VEGRGKDERIILKGILECGLDSCGSEEDPVVGSCEHKNEPLDSKKKKKKKDGEFLNYLSNY
jgi:hypothetical protein